MSQLRFFYVIVALLFLSVKMYGQSIVKKPISRYINVPNKSHIFPTLTADGMYMIFMSNYTSTGQFELVYSHKNGPESWEEAKHFEMFYKKRLDFFGSHYLSYDGQYLVFVSQRANGIGKFDILFSKKQGKGWSAPINPGKPLNSAGNEGNPCLSPDNNSIYFMRCETMDINEKSGCKIYMATRKHGDYWNEPVVLPDYVNKGNCVTPRIMIDNQTLVYASDMAGGKGKLDLYLTRNENGVWTKPVPYAFLNTENNDEYISVPARGDVVYYHEKHKDQFQIFKALVPEEYQPIPVQMVTGKLSLPAGLKVEDVMMQAYDAETNEKIGSATYDPTTGDYFLVLPQGAVYDFSVFPKVSGYTYYAALMDVAHLEKSQWDKTDIKIEPATFGSSILLKSVAFEPNSSVLSATSEIEMRRLSRFMQNNKNAVLEIGVYMDSVMMDSVARPGLSEMEVDTLYQTFQLSELGASSLDQAKDSLMNSGYHLAGEESETSVKVYMLNITYHNDRTQKQADAIVDKLQSMGAPSSRLQAVGYGDVYQQSYATENRKYWVLVKIR